MNARHSLAVAGIAIVMGTAVHGQTTRYVSPSGGNSHPYTSWGTAARSIQVAVDACAVGDTVIVTNGVYTAGTQLTVTNGITLTSANGSGVTFINGGYPSTTYRCLYISHPSTVVSGFTITNGYLTGGDAAGVFINQSGTLSNCVVSGNRSSGWGGGVRLEGGGLVTHCIIANNVGYHGGGVEFASGGLVRNSLIYGNSATYGGGMETFHGGNAENCIIAGNTASEGGGVLFRYTGSTFINTIIWSNSASTSRDHNDAGTIWSNSCTPSMVLNNGNITNNPEFVNAPTADYRLRATSPCIDAGTYLSWMAGAVDLVGAPRVQGSSVDIGPYEYGFVCGIQVSALDVTWASRLGLNYQVQYTTSLTQPAWSNLGPVYVGTGAGMYHMDVIRGLPNRFYRVVENP
jgi:hypothetical protein